MKNSLLNIILHHSYFPNIRCQIPCNGHTNNTGHNGAGKTSVLKLIPVFYGCQPEKLIDRSAQKVSFLDYYLPHPHSMIIFEYRRISGICCAVLYRHHEQAKLLYRFVNGSADETLFADFTKAHFAQGEPTGNLFHLLEAQGIRISKAINTTLDYAAVIGNRHDRFSRSRDKMLAYYARDFSLCRPGTSMRHIGDLTAVLLHKNQQLMQLRTMLVSTLNTHYPIGEKPPLDMENSLPDTIRSLHILDKNKDKLEAGLQQASILRGIYRDLSYLRDKGIIFLETFQSHKRQYEAQKLLWEEKIQQHEMQYHDKRSPLIGKQKDKRTELDTVNNHISILEKRDAEYQSQNMPQQMQEIEQLPYHEKARDDAQKHYDNLQASHQQLVNAHEKRCREVENDAAEKYKYLEEERAVAQSLYEEAGEKKDRDLDTQDAKAQEERDALESEYQKIADACQLAFVAANAKKEQAKRPTEAEAEQIKIQEQTIEEAENIWREKQAAEAQCKVRLQQHTRHLELLKKRLADAQETLRKREEEARKLNAIAYPENTLLAFLRTSRAHGWQDIARLIHPPLLLRKDLQPRWNDGSSNDFYGLQLDTEKIALPIEAEDSERLQKRLQEADAAVQRCRSGLHAQEKAQGEAFDAVRRAETDVQIACRQSEHAQNQYHAHKAAYRKLQTQIQEAMQQREEEAQSLIEKATARAEEEKSAYGKRKSALHERHTRQQSDIKKRFADAQKIWKDTCTQLDSARQQNIEEKTRRLQELEQAYQAALAEQGVDPETLADAKARLSAHQSNVARIENNRRKVSEYKVWLQTEWEQYPKLQEEREALYTELSDLDAQLKRLKNEYDTQKSEYLRGQMHIAGKLREISDKQDRCMRLEKRITDAFLDMPEYERGLQTDTEIPANANMSFEVLEELVEQTLQSRREQHEALQKAVLVATEALKTGELAKAWFARMERYQHLPHRTLPYLFAAMREIGEMCQYDIVQAERSNLENFRAMANVISEYYSKLHAFHRSVRRMSKEISAQINQEHGFPALSDIQIDLDTVLPDNLFFRELEDFHKIWQSNTGLSQLPDEDLLRAFSRAWDMLTNSNIDSADPASLVKLELHCKEQGRAFTLHHSSNIDTSSSTGISTMLIVVLFASLTRHLCEDRDTVIHWTFDELGRIDGQNTLHLFDFMDKQNIYLFCAQPEIDPSLAPYFVCKNEIDRSAGVRRYQTKPLPANPLLEKKRV